VSRPCTNDRCKLIELHAAHDKDFSPKPRRRLTRTQQAEALGRPRVVRRATTPTGVLAMVECPECAGVGCGSCVDSGLISLYRWHLWKNNNR
jgi:hypothetical protein